MKNDNVTNNYLQNTRQKTKDGSMRTELNTGVNSRCSEG